MNLAQASSKLIMVCDDEPHILRVVSTKLTSHGFKVITAPDGEAAEKLARERRPDLIFTDYQMPHVSGLELCERLQATSETADIPIVMITARGFSIQTKELSAKGILKVMTKPFSPREVLATAQELLGLPIEGCGALAGGVHA